MATNQALIDGMTKAEQDAQTIRQLEENLKRVHAELMEYIQVEKVIVAAGLLTKQKIEQAHEIVRGLP